MADSASSNSASLRVIFAGTPTFAAHHLQALLDSPHQIIAVYTQPDRPAGRGKRLSASPVKALALDNKLPVYQPTSLKNDEAQKELAALEADVMVVVAYGLLLPQKVLDTPRLGCINVHGSLLPRWRGAAPVQRAIEAGDKTSGITIMQMDAGLDTGPMLLHSECEISDDDTSDSLFKKLEALGGPALLTVLDQLASDSATPQAQDEELANYAHKIDKAEAKIDWQQPAAVLDKRIRAFNPFPIVYCECRQEKDDDLRIKIHLARLVEMKHQTQPGTIINANKNEITVVCGDNALAITHLQLPGKKMLPAADVMRGFPSLFAPGNVLL